MIDSISQNFQYLRDGGKAGTNFRDPAVRKGGMGPTLLHIFLSLSLVSLFVDFKYEPFQTKRKAQSFDQLSIFLAAPSLLGAPEKFFHRGSNPLSATLSIADPSGRVI